MIDDQRKNAPVTVTWYINVIIFSHGPDATRVRLVTPIGNVDPWWKSAVRLYMARCATRSDLAQSRVASV